MNALLATTSAQYWMNDMDIITVSEPECGGKPTVYAAILEDMDKKTIKRHLKKGFIEGFVRPVVIGESAINSAVNELVEDYYAWVGLGQEYLVEITDITEPNAKGRGMP